MSRLFRVNSGTIFMGGCESVFLAQLVQSFRLETPIEYDLLKILRHIFQLIETKYVDFG